ncbi:MAG TPA: tyrosine-type recombinase/integrase [Thermodesulfobacteriota bacterium]|nr:tyrosine-type recombinase/integrase [Thermodesulfobacteriota bacterium]
MDNAYKSILADALQGFVREREALRYHCKKEAACLKRFDRFCIDIGHNEVCLSRGLAMRWAEKKPYESDDAQGRRIRLIRMLARYMAKSGYQAYIYPDHLGVRRSETYQPYLFSEAELARFLARVDQCLPLRNSPYRHRIFPLLYRMLYGCGLRVSEALHLTVGDVNAEEGILTIRNAKFHKDRMVPMSPPLTERCRIYMEAMHPLGQPEYPFFPSPYGGRYPERTVYAYFRRFIWEAGISHGGRGKGPRVHDLRHTFAVHCLKRLVRNAVDLTVALPYLSVYLGHAGLKGTQHYLRLTAELYPDIVVAMDARFGRLLPGGDR